MFPFQCANVKNVNPTANVRVCLRLWLAYGFLLEVICATAKPSWLAQQCDSKGGIASV